jgi:hypothetical protein
MFLPLSVGNFKEHLPEVGHNGRQKHAGAAVCTTVNLRIFM